MSAHTLKYGQTARQYDTTDFQDGSIKRIMKKLSDIERAALPSAELQEVWRKSFFQIFKLMNKIILNNHYRVITNLVFLR